MRAVTERNGPLSWLGIDIRWAYGDLLPAIRRRIECGHRAQDVLHESFVRYAEAGMSPVAVTQPNAYLRRVADHVLADYWREASRYQPLLADEAETASPLHAEASPSPEKIADQRQRLAAIQRVLEHLPPRAREVFWLFRVEGLRQQEIAERLGISRNMVERHVMRALVDLRAARALLED